MGNLVTKFTTNSVELNESNVSDIVVYEPQVKKDKSQSPVSMQTKNGIFKNIFSGTFDPRSPSSFITRTPIQIFRNSSSSKFVHQELNESLNESVDLDILTAEEQESLESNKDLVDAIKDDIDEIMGGKLLDPRSPTNEIARTPIVIIDSAATKCEDNLIKKIADKLISTKISNQDNTDGQKKSEVTKKKSKAEKNLIYEDDMEENFDRFSTPPKQKNAMKESERTPLSCLANKSRNAQPRNLLTSTPKGSKIPVSVVRGSSSKIPRRIE